MRSIASVTALCTFCEHLNTPALQVEGHLSILI